MTCQELCYPWCYLIIKTHLLIYSVWGNPCLRLEGSWDWEVNDETLIVLGNWTWLGWCGRGGLVFGEGKFSLEVGDRWSWNFLPGCIKTFLMWITCQLKCSYFLDLWQCPELAADLPWLSLGLSSHIPENMTLAGKYKNPLMLWAPQHRIFL